MLYTLLTPSTFSYRTSGTCPHYVDDFFLSICFVANGLCTYPFKFTSIDVLNSYTFRYMENDLCMHRYNDRLSTKYDSAVLPFFVTGYMFIIMSIETDYNIYQNMEWRLKTMFILWELNKYDCVSHLIIKILQYIKKKKSVLNWFKIIQKRILLIL